jgi:hypothetical protein
LRLFGLALGGFSRGAIVIINLIPDSSVSSAPAGFTAAIEEAASIIEQDFSGSFTVNIRYGWGTWDNQVDPGLAGANGAEGGPVNGTVVSYQTLESWLTNAGTSPDQEMAYASLPSNTSSFPGGQTSFYVSSAQEKALGVYVGSSTAVDGAIGFGTAASPSFWLEAALHEICHALGRTTDYYAGDPTIMDLFRYSEPGQYSWTGYEPSYLSFNGGTTVAANFSTVSDYADFAVDTLTPSDPFDWMINGSTQTLTGLDIELMNVLGFSSSFQPSSITISVVGYAVVASGQSISPSSLIVNISNPNGDTVANEMYIDKGGGSGYFTVNGVAQPDGVWIYATSNETVQYVGGPSAGTDTLEFGIYDSTTNSYAFSSVISAITTGGTQASTPPTITSISDAPNSGAANIGQVVTFTLDLSEAATINGSPTLSLNDGGSAVFTGGSGSDSLTFSYTVDPADTSVSSLTVTSINLNGGSIEGANGNEANLSLTGVSQSGPQIQIPADTVTEIDAIYETVLHQAPTAAEVGAWIALEPSVGDATLISAVINSQEAEQEANAIIQIIKLGTGLLPTAAQMSGWAGYELSGGPLVTIATAFADSTMFQDIIGGGAAVDPNSAVTPAIMETIIANALGLPATDHQVDAWVATGLSVAQVFVLFALGDQYSAASATSDQQYLTEAADSAVEANGGEGNGGSSTVSTTYNDDGFMIDTLVNSAAGITNTYNFGSSAVLEAGGFNHGDAVVNMNGVDLSLEILATAAFALDSLTYNGDLVLDSTGGAIDIASVVNTSSTAVELVLTPTTICLNGPNAITISADSDQALATINGMNSTGTLSLGTTTTPFTQPDLTVLGGSGALALVASGDGDTVTELTTSVAGGTLTLAGAGDTITTAAGVNTIAAGGAQDVIQLGEVSTETTITASQIVHAAGAGDSISFATTAADGTAVFWGSGASSTVDGGNSSLGVGANDTISFGNNTGSGSETVVITGDLTGATTSGGTSTSNIVMTTLENVVHGGGDEIVFNNVATEVLASLSNSGEVNVSSATSLAQALDLAAAGAAASQSNQMIPGHTGVIDWFQYSGNTCLVEAINPGSAAASHAALAATDAVVEITGLVNLSGEVLAAHTLSL